MKDIRINRGFLDLFKQETHALKTKFDPLSDEQPRTIVILNRLEKQKNIEGVSFIKDMCGDLKLNDFVEFYSKFDSFEIGLPLEKDSINCIPLLKQLSAVDLDKFTQLYLPGGKRAWTIDLNKSNALYRSSDKWMAFAEVDGGPCCLTIFLSGENAGNIYLVHPQPPFNILKPIAKTYTKLLERIAKDPAAFFRLIRATVSVIKEENISYGFVPIRYIDDLEVEN